MSNTNWLRLENVRDEVFSTYNELFDKVSNMSFDEAFKAFKGFNLSADPFFDDEKECIVPSLKFDLKYRNIETTIFQAKGNKCEVWETAAYKLDEKSEIVFDISAHHFIGVYSIITDGKVVILEKWAEKNKG